MFIFHCNIHQSVLTLWPTAKYWISPPNARKGAKTSQHMDKDHWGSPGVSGTRMLAIDRLSPTDCGVVSLWIGLTSHRCHQITSYWYLGSLEAGWTPQPFCWVILVLSKKLLGCTLLSQLEETITVGESCCHMWELWLVCKNVGG